MMNAPLKVFTGNANPSLAKEICDFMQIPLGFATVDKFPDGETFVRIEENVRGCDVFIVQPTTNPANHHIMELLILIDAARRASASRITAVIPFFGYSRQDRKDQPRVPITSKLIANMLSAAGANRILAMDLHAQQIQGFFDIPVDHLYAAPVFYEHFLQKLKSNNNVVVYAPDVGGVKMAAAYAKLIGCQVGFVAKRRINADTVEAFNLVGDVKGCDILLVDDMVETAGTLIAAAKLLKENGANKVWATVSHGVLNSIGYERLAQQNYIDQLVTTNTTDVKTEGLPITVLSVAELLGEAIIRINQNRSISDLFDIKGF